MIETAGASTRRRRRVTWPSIVALAIGPLPFVFALAMIYELGHYETMPDWLQTVVGGLFLPGIPIAVVAGIAVSAYAGRHGGFDRILGVAAGVLLISPLLTQIPGLFTTL